MLRAKQLSVNLPNERGQLARLTRCLADAKVNIVALSVLDCAEAGTVRLVVSKPDVAAAALKEAGMAFMTSDVLVAPLRNRVGVLADAAEKLAKARVNVDYVYGSTGTGTGVTHVVIGTRNMAAAEKVLQGL